MSQSVDTEQQPGAGLPLLCVGLADYRMGCYVYDIIMPNCKQRKLYITTARTTLVTA